MQGGYQQERIDLIEPRISFARLLGASASDPTVKVGTGWTATRAGTGRYKLTFKENPGVYAGCMHGFQATTMADLAGYTCVFKDYDSTNYVVEFTVYNASFAAADLTNTQTIVLRMHFKQSNL